MTVRVGVRVEVERQHQRLLGVVVLLGVREGLLAVAVRVGGLLAVVELLGVREDVAVGHPTVALEVEATA